MERIGKLRTHQVEQTTSSSPPEPIYSGKKLSHWLRRLDVAAAEIDHELAQAAIRNIGTAAIPFLVTSLQRGGRDAQRVATAFGVLGADAASAVAEIERNPGPEPCFAALALAGIGGPAFNALVSFLTHKHPLIRSAGAEGISSALINKRLEREQARTCLPQLVRNTQDPHPHVRARSASAIGMIGAEPALCVPALMSLLNEHSGLVLFSAVQALGSYGQAALVALPNLLTMAKAADAHLRSVTVETLSRLQQPQAYESVKAALNDDNLLVRIAAVNGLGNFPDHATEVVPILVEVLRSECATLKWNSLWALGRLGPLAKESLPVVRKLLENPDAAGGEITVRLALQQIEGRSQA